MHPGSQSTVSAGALATPSRLTAVLFTDVVDSTTAALRLGDAAWATLLERHNAIVRQAVREHGGVEMDTAGDGLFAVFDDAADALRCARALRDALLPLGLVLRAGVHAGHCWTADGKCAGADVHVHPEGRFVYCSNRGHDSIAAFEIGDSSALRALARPWPSQGGAA